MSEIEVSTADAGAEAAQWAMTQYFDELAARFPEGFDASGALDGAGTSYQPPSGVFFLAHLDSAVVGCAALQFLDSTRAEVKRMWVSPAVRGRGLATLMLGRLEREALAAGRSTVVLDTHGSLTEAIALYGRRGYVRIACYNDNPYAQLWFGKELAADG